MVIAVSASAKSSVAPEVAQATSNVVSGLKISSVPGNMTPSLAQLSAPNGSFLSSGVSYIRSECDAYDSPAVAAAPVPCVYGDINATKAIVLYGDSHASAWIPALDIVASKLHERLVVFAFAGCATSLVAVTKSGTFADASRTDSCNDWHRAIGQAVRAAKPSTLIVTAGIGYATYSKADTATWIGGMSAAFKEMTRGLAGVTKIYLGTTPLFERNVPNCVALHSGNVKGCSLTYGSNDYYGRLLTRDVAIAKAAHVSLVAPTVLFCSKGHCPPIVGTSLVYVDVDHISTAYAIQLAPAIGAMLNQAGVR
jgi:hypothetical protein